MAFRGETASLSSSFNDLHGQGQGDAPTGNSAQDRVPDVLINDGGQKEVDDDDTILRNMEISPSVQGELWTASDVLKSMGVNNLAFCRTV